MIELNKKVENFTLQGIDKDGNEKEFSLSDFEGKDTIIYFYPKDNTPGCTQQACDFRDNINMLTSRFNVIGISPDSVESHKKFREKQDLNFTLLSDPEHKAMETFGTWGEKKNYGKTYLGVIRSTFLIDKEGFLKKEWRNVKAKGHVEKILKEIG